MYVICILIQLGFDLVGGEKQESQVRENIGLDFPISSPLFFIAKHTHLVVFSG